MLTKICTGLIQITLFLGLGLGLVGCSKVDPTDLSQDGTVSLAEKNPHRCQHEGKNCFKETFQQPVRNTRAVDILFVIQTSDPLATEKQAIVAGINNFISSLPANSDFNIAVMLAHGSTSSQSGRLFRADSEPVVLKSTELTTAQIQTHLSTKLNLTVADPGSGGGEEGLFSLFNGITTPALLADSQAAGFFRPDAALGVIFVADRRDICAVVPAGVPAETDPVKIDARVRDCEGLTAAGLTSRLRSLKGASPLAVSGIIYTDPPVPAGNEIGYGYLDVINLNSGIAIDIANDDIATGLASMAQLSGQQMTTQNQFKLSHSGVNPATVKVTVNGQPVAFTIQGDTVTISQSIPAGALIAISYCVKKLEDQCRHGKRNWHDRHWHGKKETCHNPDDDSSDDDSDSDDDDGSPIKNCAALLSSNRPLDMTAVKDLNLKGRSGNTDIGSVRNLSLLGISGNLTVQSALNVTSIQSVSGNLILNALKVGSVCNISGNYCIKAEEIGSVASSSGKAQIKAKTIGSLTVHSGTLHVYGATINRLESASGNICLHDGAKIVNLNRHTISGTIKTNCK
jgi:hypothetical protein